MKNLNLNQEGSVDSHPLKKLAEKMVSVNLAVKEFRMESQRNTRLGVIIDWTKGTMKLLTGN